MIFNLSMTAFNVKEKDTKIYKKYGFKFQPETSKFWIDKGLTHKLINDDIKIDIKSIEELKEMIDDLNGIGVPAIMMDGEEIQIYNDYIQLLDQDIFSNIIKQISKDCQYPVQ